MAINNRNPLDFVKWNCKWFIKNCSEGICINPLGRSLATIENKQSFSFSIRANIFFLYTKEKEWCVYLIRIFIVSFEKEKSNIHLSYIYINEEYLFLKLSKIPKVVFARLINNTMTWHQKTEKFVFLKYTNSNISHANFFKCKILKCESK